MMRIETRPKTLFANQRTVKIHKKPIVSGKFSTINIAATLKAMHDLLYSAYMLYSYLSLNADKYELYLSKEFLCKHTASTRNTYYSAIHELEEKGCLALRPNFEAKYDFYETPKSEHPCTQKQDTVCQKTVENMNNNEKQRAARPAA